MYKLADAEEEGGPQLEIEAVDPEDEEAKFKQPETEDQGKLENWLHFPKAILLNNRTGHLEPEVPEGVEAEPADLLKEILKKDPYVPRLKPVSADEGVDGHDKAWTVNLHGIKTRSSMHGKLGKKDSKHYGVVVLRSLRWPGAVTCWKGIKQYQIYVGDGLKNEEQSFYPVFPPEIPEDPEDQECHDEPNPKDAPQTAEEPKEEDGEGEAQEDE